MALEAGLEGDGDQGRLQVKRVEILGGEASIVRLCGARPTWIVRPWARMDALEVCQIKVAQRAGVGSCHLSQNHVRPAQSTAGSAEEAARSALPTDADGAGDAHRGEGAGLAQG